MRTHTLKIYQVDVHAPYSFWDYQLARKKGADFKTLKDYTLVYEGEFHSWGKKNNEVLEEIFTEGNIGRLRTYMTEFCKTARSISVSDIIELDGTRYYCNSFGFVKVGVS